LGNYAFGAEPLISRLFRVIRSELGWTYSIGSTYNATGPLTHQQGFFVIHATPSIEFTGKTLFKTLSMWAEYMNSGLKSDELLLAQESLINSYPFEFDSAEKRLGQRLHSYLYGVPILSPEEYAKKLKGISNKSLKSALKDHQTSQGWMVTVVADSSVIEKELAQEQAEVPAEKRLAITKKLTPDQLIE
jgi:predicted Zn-dependent peptidase